MRPSAKRTGSIGAINSNLINSWRVFVYSSMACLFSLLLINNGWSKINKEKIYISGNTYISREKIIDSLQVNLPLKLLTFNPKYYEEILLSKLPIKAIKVNRSILPPSIYIVILERKPVANATRNGSNGIETGMIDKEGVWIASMGSNQTKLESDEKIMVKGWMKSHRRRIAEIFLARNKLGSPLKKIILSPNGDIKLETDAFKAILLGSNKNLLSEQINTLPYLIKSVPKKFADDSQTIIDIKDPSKPKLLRSTRNKFF